MYSSRVLWRFQLVPSQLGVDLGIFLNVPVITLTYRYF